VTDVVGMLLLLPPVRRLAGRAVLHAAARRLPPEVSAALLGPMQVRSRRIRSRRGATTTVPPDQSADLPPRTTAPSAGTVIDGELER
jgi:UPF0716 protein FxsA